MRRRGRLAVAAAALLALALIGSALAASSAKKPITIGWAFDGNGAMAPFDGPALAAAKLRVNQINAKGGVNGRKLQLLTCDTQGNKPDVAKACALRLLSQKADVLFTTCDVDLAAPVVRVAIDRGLLDEAAHSVRTPLPRDPHPEQHAKGRGDDRREGRGEDLSLV